MGKACPSCSYENPEGARFCMSCGSALERRCPVCDTPLPPEARFCMSCGTPLDEPTRPAAQAAALPEERRQVTVLFADLSGYTAVAERMDPEAVKGLVERCLRRLGDEVERYGGTVDKYIGDNVMAIFGAPVAHEDDAERAVRAALAMQAAMVDINENLDETHGVTFALRVGVNTGEVLAGAVGRDYTVIGDTVNVAARLQTAGRPGSVTVGERTYRATSHAVEYRPLESLELKGRSDRVQAWEALSVVAAQPAGRVLGRAEAPLVGRREELQLVSSLYGRVVTERRPHLVTLIGQAGVGKTRLTRELAHHLERHPSPPTVRQGRCLPYGSSIVFWALGEVLRAECGIVDSDPADVAWEKMAGKVEMLSCGGDSRRTAALMGRLLGIEAPPDVPMPDIHDPQRMRESFFAAVQTAVEAMARRNPLLLIFEDIHWADQGMLDLIEHLGQWVRGPLLILCLARDELLERRPGWGGGRRGATSIFLEPLSPEETRDLIATLMPGDALDEALVPVVAERAGGNPFFAEEMVRLLAEEGGSNGGELPDTVQALLAARLDSLDPFERRLVQHASVVGRTFWQGSLDPVADSEGRDLSQALAALQEKDIVVPGEGSRLAGEPELAFKHVLIRDVAYGMLPKAVRARKHFDVGTFVEERAGDRTDEVVALLAEHYGRAAVLGREATLEASELERIERKAVIFLEAAGDAALTFYSNAEAFSHYQAARDLARRHDPEALARIGEKQGDAALRLGRVDAAIAVWEECLEHHRMQENLERLADLHRKIGSGHWHRGDRRAAIEHHQKGINLLKDGPPCLELVRLYEEAAWLYMQTGDNMLAIYASEKALRLAERMGETRAASRAHGIFGRVFGRIGDMAKARENLERAVELARGSDEGETILALLALGQHLEVSEADYGQAQAAYADALALAEEIGDVPAQVELHAALGWLALYRADWDAVRESSEASSRLSEQQGLVGKLCLSYVLRGILRWREGDWDEAERLYRRAHELAEQVGWSEAAFSALFGLAMTQRDGGDFAGAVTTLSQALDVCERAGLISQSIQAIASRAEAYAMSGRPEQGREAAEEAVLLAERLHYPVGHAAALQADGFTS
ncbi:MAG TPA: adenylate/guanylate cyclase domain-containing protein, partial [Thermoleophilaceae bacterium]|nr:adenylate/guanylate cyclase domain-containing protein [Thermoleophilaceae bacterium]